MFFNSYRNRSIIGKDFNLSFRRQLRYYWEPWMNRAWGNGWWVLANLPFGDANACMIGWWMWYAHARLWATYNQVENFTEACVMKRWGPSTAEVNKALRPEDYIRARLSVEKEGAAAFLAESWLLVRPEGFDEKKFPKPDPVYAHH